MTRMYGLTPELWAAARAEIRHLMQQAAREGRLITYGEITGQMMTVRAHPGSYVFTAMLREACREEEEATGVQLCALVVARATGRPGAGYFRSLPCDAEHLDECWQAEREAAFRYYRDDTP
jgi:hypothetical protein